MKCSRVCLYALLPTYIGRLPFNRTLPIRIFSRQFLFDNEKKRISCFRLTAKEFSSQKKNGTKYKKQERKKSEKRKKKTNMRFCNLSYVSFLSDKRTREEERVIETPIWNIVRSICVLLRRLSAGPRGLLFQLQKVRSSDCSSWAK